MCSFDWGYVVCQFNGGSVSNSSQWDVNTSYSIGCQFLCEVKGFAHNGQELMVCRTGLLYYGGDGAPVFINHKTYASTFRIQRQFSKYVISLGSINQRGYNHIRSVLIQPGLSKADGREFFIIVAEPMLNVANPFAAYTNTVTHVHSNTGINTVVLIY